MELKTLQLIIDFGFTVLIWAVQLIIYPSFMFYNHDNLVTWHKIYTARVTFIVLPLMITQLIVTSISAYHSPQLSTIFSLIIVVSLWFLTFSIFVPIHQKIDMATYSKQDLHKLVNKNKYRTFLWTFLFVLSTVNFFINP